MRIISKFLPAFSKACFGEQQQPEFIGTYPITRLLHQPSTVSAIEPCKNGDPIQTVCGNTLPAFSSHQKPVSDFQPGLCPYAGSLYATMRASSCTGRKTLEIYCWGGQHCRSPELPQAHSMDLRQRNSITRMKSSLCCLGKTIWKIIFLTFSAFL